MERHQKVPRTCFSNLNALGKCSNLESLTAVSFLYWYNNWINIQSYKECHFSWANAETLANEINRQLSQQKSIREKIQQHMPEIMLSSRSQIDQMVVYFS